MFSIYFWDMPCKGLGIKLLYYDFEHPVYKQLWGDFIPNLSVIDFLFNCGKSAFSIFKRD